MIEQLGVFAKFWQPGRVMTRLGHTIGAGAASRLQREFLRVLLSRFATCGDRRVVGFTPDDARHHFMRLAEAVGVAGQWEFQPQPEGDLGHRMRGFFADAFDSGVERVVLLGADSPNLPREWVDEAFRLLSDVDVVLGPTLDGGYYLVAARDRIPPIFADIPWSSGEVFAATVAKLQQSGCRFEQLETWYDVDRIDDLRRLEQDLRELATPEGPLEELREAVAIVLRSTA